LTERRQTGLLANIVRHFATHPWRVVATWVVLIFSLGALSQALPSKFVDEFKLPGSDFTKAQNLLDAKFSARKGAELTVVVAAPPGQTLNTPERKAALLKLLAIIPHTPAFSGITSPLTPGNISKDGRIGYGQVNFSKQSFDLKRGDIVKLENSIRDTLKPVGVQAEFTGEAENPPPEFGLSEILGYLAAFIVLMVVFRTFVATLIPLVLAFVSVATANLLLGIGTHVTNFNSITPLLVSMIGIGVGIDYTLFIVTRFRQALHEGLPPREAAATAGATAGRAVIFAGTTVAISITGLAFIGIDFITKLGVGSALGVLTSVLLATTLLPAVLALLGHKVDRWKVPFLKKPDESPEGRARTPVARWGRFVSGRAKIVFPCTLILLAVLAAPAIAVRLGLADAGTAPHSSTTRKAYDLLATGFGPGFNGPIPIVIDQTGDPNAATKIDQALQGVAGIAKVDNPVYNKAKDVALVNVTSATSPQSNATNDLVSHIKNDIVPKALAGSAAKAYVSGETAAFSEIGDVILSHMPYFLLYIIGVTFLLLAMAFRSIVIALKAAITTIISAFVGFGVLIFVIQQGHGFGFIGLDRTGPIESFVMPIAFSILFGLSMDYEVFLMSRIREEHVHGKDTVHAVTDGVAAIGRVVVAAAIIMATVFAAFMINPDRVSKEFGLLLSVAILTDALIIRMTLVPALLTLLKEKTWYMPGWLDRILPNLTIEPPAERMPEPAPEPREPEYATS
jgi:RND superfamily putative drug exporter